MRYSLCLVAAVFLSLVAGGPAAFGTPAGAPNVPTDSTEAALTVRFGEAVIERPVMAVFAMPLDTVGVTVTPSSPVGSYSMDVTAGGIERVEGDRWRFVAPPAPGLHPITVTDRATGRSVRLQLFVLTPWTPRSRRLEGYRIGRYRKTTRRKGVLYERPRGFIRVTAQTKTARVSPHFRLEQFLCKQTESMPQFALVETSLLQALERILAAVQSRGIDAQTLHVMSGFRTPYYNRSIGNTTSYSRHLYGDAADVFVDTDGNGRMDDLTGDGRVTKADARRLAEIVKQTEAGPDGIFQGGLSTYGPAPHRGPFVHLDLRGTAARW